LVKPGAVTLAIDGQAIATNEEFHALLNRKAGVPVELTMVPAPGSKPATQTVTPVSMEQERELAYDHIGSTGGKP